MSIAADMGSPLLPIDDAMMVIQCNRDYAAVDSAVCVGMEEEGGK